MTPDLFWVRGIEPHRLAIMPRPRSGDWLGDEILGLKRAGVETLVSLLEQHEIQELGLDTEPRLCGEAGIGFLHYPIVDRGLPVSMDSARELIRGLVGQVKAGAGVAIHCRAGIGRSGMMAGAVLCDLGFSSAEALRVLSAARRVSVPDTAEQAQWLERYARGGLT